MTDTVTGTKTVTLTEKPKAKRQSFRAAVKQLEVALAAKIVEVEASRDNVFDVTSKHDALEAELRALGQAYNLVKPQPRTRKKDTKS